MNKLDEHLDRIQEFPIQHMDTGIVKVGAVAAVGTALIIANLVLVFMEIRKLRRDTKKSPKYTKILNRILKTNDWTVNIVDDQAPNAFAAGGKYVFITSGLTKHLSEREITAVLLHEVYHNKKKHMWKQLAYEYPFYYLLLSYIMFGLAPTAYGTYFLAYLVFKIGLAILRIPYKIIVGRRHEYKSDEYAIKYGYSDELVSAFKKFEVMIAKEMKKQKCGRLCKIVNTIDKAIDEHPSFKNRIENILKKKDTMKNMLSGNFGKIKNAIVKAIGPEGKKI